jgi:hypothetical protein
MGHRAAGVRMLAMLIIVLAGMFFFLRVFIAFSADQKHSKTSAVTNLGSERFEFESPVQRQARVIAFQARLRHPGKPLKASHNAVSHRFHA